ncbi:hypothetical protein [Streptomyces sp. NPDC051183]|uniref:hypothetical protein n=1 Tax=unclassified Streptomyces TaxID=2593676 RepID=UPI0034486354
MSWNPQPRSVAAPPSAAAARVRMHAGIGAALFLPALFLAKVLVLTTETGSRCLEKGGCTPFPAAAFGVLTGAAAVALVAALAAPRRVRAGALAAQLLLEAVAVGTVLVYP